MNLISSLTYSKGKYRTLFWVAIVIYVILCFGLNIYECAEKDTYKDGTPVPVPATALHDPEKTHIFFEDPLSSDDDTSIKPFRTTGKLETTISPPMHQSLGQIDDTAKRLATLAMVDSQELPISCWKPPNKNKVKNYEKESKNDKEKEIKEKEKEKDSPLTLAVDRSGASSRSSWFPSAPTSRRGTPETLTLNIPQRSNNKRGHVDRENKSLFESPMQNIDHLQIPFSHGSFPIRLFPSIPLETSARSFSPMNFYETDPIHSSSGKKKITLGTKINLDVYYGDSFPNNIIPFQSLYFIQKSLDYNQEWRNTIKRNQELLDRLGEIKSNLGVYMTSATISATYMSKHSYISWAGEIQIEYKWFDTHQFIYYVGKFQKKGTRQKLPVVIKIFVDDRLDFLFDNQNPEINPYTMATRNFLREMFALNTLYEPSILEGTEWSGWDKELQEGHKSVIQLLGLCNPGNPISGHYWRDKYDKKIITNLPIIIYPYYFYDIITYYQHFSLEVSDELKSDMIKSLMNQLMKYLLFTEHKNIVHGYLNPSIIGVEIDKSLPFKPKIKVRHYSKLIATQGKGSDGISIPTASSVQDYPSSSTVFQRRTYEAIELFMGTSDFGSHLDMWSAGVIMLTLCGIHADDERRSIEIYPLEILVDDINFLLSSESSIPYEVGKELEENLPLLNLMILLYGIDGWWDAILKSDSHMQEEQYDYAALPKYQLFEKYNTLLLQRNAQRIQNGETMSAYPPGIFKEKGSRDKLVKIVGESGYYFLMSLLDVNPLMRMTPREALLDSYFQ